MAIGIVLTPGTHVGVPSGWIQRSEQFYTQPEIFNGYRFVKGDVSAPDSQFADLSPEYLVFGMGVHAWYVNPFPNPTSYPNITHWLDPSGDLQAVFASFVSF